MSPQSPHQISVKRLTNSSYFSPEFIGKEKKALESIKDVIYDEGAESSADVYITNSNTRPRDMQGFQENWTPETLIIHPNSGHENLDFILEKYPQAMVVLGNSIRAQAVAEYVVSCAFDAFVGLPTFSSWPHKRSWDSRQSLSSMNLLLIGQGHVGKIVKERLGPWMKSMAVIDPDPQKLGAERELRPHHLSHADVIVFCCDLNPSTEKFFGRQQFQQLRPNVMIVNPARGAIFDEGDLIQFLKENPLARAYLDVFCEEPTDFRRFPASNSFCTPHIAGVFPQLENEMIEFEKIIIETYIRALKEKNWQRFKTLWSFKKSPHE